MRSRVCLRSWLRTVRQRLPLMQIRNPGYVQQYNLDVQREVGWGWFIDAAYAGSHGVHLQQYSTNIDQIPDNFVAQAGAQCPGFTRR